MVNMKIDLKGAEVDVNASSGFEPYEGPLPTPGVFAAVIQSCKVRISQNDNPYFNVLLEFADQDTPEKEKFKNYPLWTKVVPGESDIQKERVAKLLYTVSGKDPSKVNVVIDHDEVTAGGTVNKIGGKDPVGVRCRVTVQRQSYNGEPTCEMRDLFPWPKDKPWPTGSDDAVADEEAEVEEEIEEPEEEVEESDAAEEEEEEEEEEDDDAAFTARQEELRELDRTALKAVIKELDSEFKILKRHTDEDLANAILDIEYPPVGDEDSEAPPF